MTEQEPRRLQSVKEVPEELLSVKDPSYSPDKFYTRAVDGKGHGIKVNVRLPPGTHARIRKIIQAGKIPQYDTMEAFARDAINHRLVYVTGNYNVLSNREMDAIVREMALAELEQIQDATTRQQEGAKKLADALLQCVKKQDKEAFLKTVEVGYRLAEACGEPWKSTIQKTLKLYQEKLNFDN